MDFSTLADEIAAVAHRCWCKQMTEEGWRPGEEFDAGERTHPALRPYAELCSLDRAQIRYMVTHRDCVEDLAFPAAEALDGCWHAIPGLRVGLRVRLVDGDPADIGTVVSFTPTASEPEIIDEVVVRWPNGDVVSYCPTEGEIAAVDSDPADCSLTNDKRRTPRARR